MTTPANVLRWAVAGLATFTLTSCVTIVSPEPGDVLSTASVQAEVSFATPVCQGTFRAELDGRDVTSEFSPIPPSAANPRATLTELSPGEHTLFVRAETKHYWVIIPICNGSTETVTFTTELPSLGFNTSGPLTLVPGESRNIQITLTPTRTVETDVSLSSNANSVVTVSPGAATIPPDDTQSQGTVLIEAQGLGDARITASADGAKTARLNVSIPQPDFEVSMTPQDDTVAWGEPATYNVVVQSVNEFSEPVTLSISGAPAGANPVFSPATVTPQPNGSVQATLSIQTFEAATRPGESSFDVYGDAGGVSKTATGTITITRKDGAFSVVFSEDRPLRETDGTCGPDVEAVVTATGMGPTVIFTSPLGEVAQPIGAGYQFTSMARCRAAVVVPPVVNSPILLLFNLQFPPTTDAPEIDEAYSVLLEPIEAWASPDDSLVAVVGPSGPGSPRDHALVLVDVVNEWTSSAQFFDGGVTGISVTGDEVEVTTATVTFPIDLP